MIELVAGFIFDNPIGKALAGALLGITVFGVWLWQHDAKVAAAATSDFTTTINEKAEKQIDAAIKARAPAHRPGAAERLRQGSCYDC